MRARLQSHVSRTPPRAGACLPQRPDLRMIAVGVSVPAWPTILPFRTTTHPTAGFGLAWPTPRAASLSAARM